MRKLLRFAFSLVTAFCILIYLPSCLVYLVSPAQWWPMGILCIGFPYLWFSLLGLFIVWLFVKRKVAVWVFALLIVGLPMMENVVALHLPTEFAIEKKAGELRVMQWNCQGFQGAYPEFAGMVVERHKAVQLLQKYQPDVLCLSEFTNATRKNSWSNISLLRDSLGYRYFVFHPYYTDEEVWSLNTTGNAIFSKYPITDSSFFSYPGKQYPEDILKADINFNGKKLRVLTTHLASMHLHHIIISGPIKRYLYQDSVPIYHGSFIDKLKYYQPYHVSQASFLRKIIDTSHVPLIVGGDFNSVPSSYVYNKIKGNLSDAFLEKGSGLGRSFHSSQPALRIDYLFHSKELQVRQWGIFRISFSDHDPEIMDVTIE